MYVYVKKVRKIYVFFDQPLLFVKSKTNNIKKKKKNM